MIKSTCQAVIEGSCCGQILLREKALSVLPINWPLRLGHIQMSTAPRVHWRVLGETGAPREASTSRRPTTPRATITGRNCLLLLLHSFECKLNLGESNCALHPLPTLSPTQGYRVKKKQREGGRINYYENDDYENTTSDLNESSEQSLSLKANEQIEPSPKAALSSIAIGNLCFNRVVAGE